MPSPSLALDDVDTPASPCLPTAPPAYSPPADAIGDEPSCWSEKSAPPPYAAADPEPSATALLRAEQRAASAAASASASASAFASAAARVPRTPARQLSTLSTLSVLSGFSVCESPLGTRALTAPHHARWLDSDSDSDSELSEISDFSEDSDVSYVRVADPDDGESTGSAFSHPSAHSHPDRAARVATADPKWCGREAIWWRASQRARHRRTASVNSLHEQRERFESCSSV